MNKREGVDEIGAYDRLKKERDSLSDSYVKGLIRAAFSGDITPSMIKNKREEIEFKRKEGSTPKKRTNPSENIFQRSYWYPEDGECSLNNPIVRRRLTRYVYKFINKYWWITKKNFIDPEEVFFLVQEDIKHLQPFQYGDENTNAILFLIIKIKIKISQEWWNYAKANMPAFYREHRGEGARARSATYYQENKEDLRYRAQMAKAQKKQRDKLADGYLIAQVSANLKRATGMTYTFEEIRDQYSHLIEEKRIAILNKRSRSHQSPLPELNDIYLSKVLYGEFYNKGIKITRNKIREQFPELINKKREEILKKREGVRGICATAIKPLIEYVEVATITEADVFYMVHVGKKYPARFDRYEDALAEAKNIAKKKNTGIFITKGIKSVDYIKKSV